MHAFLIRKFAPTNNTGGTINNYDPILISLVRRAMPNLIAYDVCSVQPMTGPTGLIFAMKSRFASSSGTEALFNEPDASFSNDDAAGDLNSTAMTGTNPAVLNDAICWYIYYWWCRLRFNYWWWYDYC